MMISSAADYQTRLGLDFTPSSYQVNVFSEVAKPGPNLVVDAVAGAGKSATLGCVVRLVSCAVLVVAFNREIMLDQRTKLADTDARVDTVHSHGLACVSYSARREAGIQNVKIEDAKYSEMVKRAAEAIELRGEIRGLPPLTRAQREAITDDGFPLAECVKLIELARLSLIDMDADLDTFSRELMALADRHGADTFDACLDDMVVNIVRRCMLIGADTWNTIDFVDMLWLPVVNGWRPRRFAMVLVDEAQDLSRCALALIKNSIYSGGRLVFFGDPKQSIYAFAGADADSFQTIIDECQAKVLPLSICFRCPTAVLDMAREYCPQIEARKGAPEGIVRKATRDAYIAEAKHGDLVLCRRNAPLLGLCFALIAEGIPAVVRGRAIAEGLVKIVEKVCKRIRFSDFRKGLDAWERKQVEIATKRAKNADKLADRIEAIGDKAECLRVMYSRTQAATAGAFGQAIRDLFSDDRGAVTLSSIHRAKGLEADRVVVVEMDRLLNPRCRQPEDLQQERNLAYVCITRAKRELIILDESAPVAPKPTRDDDTKLGEDIQSREAAQLARNIEVVKGLGSTDDATRLAAKTAYFAGTSAEVIPAPLPEVAADAPDAYHPDSRPGRVALARMLDARLRSDGFRATRIGGAHETVYVRSAGDSLECMVYSTIVGGACRENGKDSIKVCMVDHSERQCRGVRKSKRVNRVGKLTAIIDRVVSRIEGLLA